MQCAPCTPTPRATPRNWSTRRRPVPLLRPPTSCFASAPAGSPRASSTGPRRGSATTGPRAPRPSFRATRWRGWWRPSDQPLRGYAVGDEVYGLIDFRRDGADAEYVAARATELAPKPAALTHAQAAAAPLSALTAWQALFDHGGSARRPAGADPRRGRRGGRVRGPTRPMARGSRRGNGVGARCRTGPGTRRR